MPKCAVLAVAVLAASMFLSSLAIASPPQPPLVLAWNLATDWQYRAVYRDVEQDVLGQTVNPTWNTTKCPWDVDDLIQLTTNGGSFAAGATLTLDECLIGDAEHVIGLVLQSPHPNLQMTLTVSSAADTRTFTVARDDIYAGDPGAGLPYGWRGCLMIAYRDDNPWQQPIKDSNGGFAVPTTIRLTVHNSGAAVISDRRHAAVTAAYGLAPIFNYPEGFQDSRCPSGYQLDRTGTPLGYPVTGNIADPIYYFSGLDVQP